MRALITAIRTLTIIPVPGKDTEKFSDSLYFFPFIGTFIGALIAACTWGIGLKLGWAIGAGAVAVAVSSFVTRGLHLDGFADAFDALGGSTKERRLEIMKDPRIGSFGVIALCVLLFLKFAALARLAEAPHMLRWMIIPYLASRTVQVQLIVLLPYARAEGGTARSFIEGSSPKHCMLASVLAVALTYLIAGPWSVLFLAALMALTPLLAVWMKKTYGGITGDLIGMGSELTETAGLLVLVILTLTKQGAV